MKQTTSFSGIVKKGTYVCSCCGKTTRETAPDAASVELCADCYFEAAIENAMNDYSMPRDVAERYAHNQATQEDFDKYING